eukprot:CAMPEP_0172471262 /NCGR_PEP_ID=MMETSP1065-20121228/67729_1 /TAXON_ID=265537 /ORGANISM="Amphiprora paludosa, Strain CCMP125" /LENGTH=180 /DNA_ID=CAMNT_0013229357 /DNA_START=86 /DNA_END=629 /DNA_ORIENTATION=-
MDRDNAKPESVAPPTVSAERAGHQEEGGAPTGESNMVERPMTLLDLLQQGESIAPTMPPPPPPLSATRDPSLLFPQEQGAIRDEHQSDDAASSSPLVGDPDPSLLFPQEQGAIRDEHQDPPPSWSGSSSSSSFMIQILDAALALADDDEAMDGLEIERRLFHDFDFGASSSHSGGKNASQ